MYGTYLIIDIEPNRFKDKATEIIRISWIITQITEQGCATFISEDYIINNFNNKSFNNINYNFHGITASKQKLEGESLKFVLERLVKALVDYNVDFILGYGNKRKNDDLDILTHQAHKLEINLLRKEVLEKKFIVIDLVDFINDYITKNGYRLASTHEEMYKLLLNTEIPKTKFHNTLNDCDFTKNILYWFIVNDIELFDAIKPFVEEKIDFKKLDEYVELIDKTLLDKNQKLENTIQALQNRVLQLQVIIENKDEKINEHTFVLDQKDFKYEKLVEKNAKLQLKFEQSINENNNLNQKLNDQKTKNKDLKEKSRKLINSLKNRIEHLQRPVQELVAEEVEKEFSVYEIQKKMCFVCSGKVDNVCEGCRKWFCNLHVTDINDGFHTVACDSCFKNIIDEMNKYKIDDNIILINE